MPSECTTTLGSVDNPYIGDIWDQDGLKAIPVNLGGIHGRGLAKQALDMGFIRYRQNRCFAESNFGGGIICVAVKGKAPETAKIPGQAWSEQVAKGNLRLLEGELMDAVTWTKGDASRILWVPFLGLGFGEGSPREILPILRKAEGPQVRFIKPDASYVGRYAAALKPSVRQDRRVLDMASPKQV